jgi:hypothetical protein
LWHPHQKFIVWCVQPILLFSAISHQFRFSVCTFSKAEPHWPSFHTLKTRGVDASRPIAFLDDLATTISSAGHWLTGHR